jgi:hypothetical protein
MYAKIEIDFDVFEEYCKKYDEHVSCGGEVENRPYGNGKDETELPDPEDLLYT